MGLIDNIRYRISAALSPQQMSRQISKPAPKGSDNWFDYMDKLGINEYNDMLKDPQIKAGYELIRNSLLSRKVIVTPADDTPESQEIANELEDMLNGMDYPMRKVRNDIYSALVYGYSVSEIIWGADEDNDKISIKRIRPIPISTLIDCFEYDDNGDIKAIKQTDPEGGEDIIIDPDKCLIYTYDEQFGDREGKSILDAVYDNWYWKQKILQYWNIYLQKHEGPTLAAYIENPAWKDEARYQLEAVHEGRTNITLGMNDRVEVLESGHRGEGFKEAINYHDVMIFRKMNIGTMILGQEDGSGAYAQSKTQMDTLSIFLDGIHEDIAAELQIKCNEWIDMHYNVELYPKVGFETFEEMDMLGLLTALKPLIDALAIDPHDKWFKQLLADVISKYSDVDMKEFLDEEEQEESETEEPPAPEVVPSQQEQEEPQPAEQAEMIEDITKTIPAKEE